MQVIDKMVLIHPQVQIWSGMKKLTPEDIGYNPPKDLVNLGRKRLVPKWSLNELEKLKKRVHRTMETYGIRLMGGYAVTEEVADDARQALERIESDFNAARSDFLANLDHYIEKQIEAYPDWENIIREAAKDILSEVPKKMNFGFTAYKVKPPQTEADDGSLQPRFISDNEVKDRAIEEIRSEAADLMASIAERTELKISVLSVVSRIRDKMSRLSQVDRPLLGKATKVTDLVMSEMPSSGKLTEDNRRLLVSLVIALSRLDKELVQSGFRDGEYEDLNVLVAQHSLVQANDEGSEDSIPAEVAEAEGASQENEEEFVWF